MIFGGQFAPDYPGGNGQIACSCLGSGSPGDVVVCPYHSASGWASCSSMAGSYCFNTYHGGMECDYHDHPEP